LLLGLRRRTPILIGILDVHLFLVVAPDELGTGLSLSRLFQLQQEVFLILIVFDGHLDAVLVVGPRKHEFTREELLPRQLALARLQFLDAVGISG
jgi:hypothetical protein